MTSRDTEGQGRDPVVEEPEFHPAPI